MGDSLSTHTHTPPPEDDEGEELGRLRMENSMLLSTIQSLKQQLLHCGQLQESMLASVLSICPDASDCEGEEEPPVEKRRKSRSKSRKSPNPKPAAKAAAKGRGKVRRIVPAGILKFNKPEEYVFDPDRLLPAGVHLIFLNGTALGHSYMCALRENINIADDDFQLRLLSAKRVWNEVIADRVVTQPTNVRIGTGADRRGRAPEMQVVHLSRSYSDKPTQYGPLVLMALDSDVKQPLGFENIPTSISNPAKGRIQRREFSVAAGDEFGISSWYRKGDRAKLNLIESSLTDRDNESEYVVVSIKRDSTIDALESFLQAGYDFSLRGDNSDSDGDNEDDNEDDSSVSAEEEGSSEEESGSDSGSESDSSEEEGNSHNMVDSR